MTTLSPALAFFLTGLVAALALWVALAIDRWCGEPANRWHPVVWMGNYLARAGAWLQRRVGHVANHNLAWLGMAAWLLGAAMVSVLAWGLQLGLEYAVFAAFVRPPWGLWQLLVVLGVALAMGVLLKPLLAWAMLRREVLAVEQALSAPGDDALAQGRAQLARLVSRDVTTLNAVQVRESAIETLAENLNDSVVAPIFWFVLLGLPGAALYRFANTADAMWGYRGVYKGQEWEWAGKFAARADDVLSWLPARITGVLLMLLAAPQALGQLRAQARLTPSPNSGWPMAAMALALGVRLAKPGGYTLHAAGRDASAADTAQAANWAGKVVLLVAVLAQFAVLFSIWRA